jgi:hypothetical protein
LVTNHVPGNFRNSCLFSGESNTTNNKYNLDDIEPLLLGFAERIEWILGAKDPPKQKTAFFPSVFSLW